MSKPIKIYLGDLAYFNRYTISTLYTPLNIGYLAVYLKQQFGAAIEVSLFKDPREMLQAIDQDQPIMVGLSLFYWNTNLNKSVIEIIREKCGKKVIIVLGGPSVDTDEQEQMKLFERFPEVDALIPNEGELGLANLVGQYLSNPLELWDSPLDGVTFKKENSLIHGVHVGLSLDLSQLGSPYLSGFMDGFIHGHYQPLIQTMRSCPYTCAFCVSGKNKSKLRSYPIEQVKEEITFLAKAYSDRPHFYLFIADENFGILLRDAEIAAYIKECSNRFQFPRRVFFYNDKRFSQTSRDVLENLGDLNSLGLAISLQSENEATLEAINRHNLTPAEIDSAITWASSKGLVTSTELIFGLPFETKQSFVNLLETSVKRGFDSILCHNLFLMDGIEMNRCEYRDKYNLKTKFRLVGTNYGYLDQRFSAEVEEVVISTSDFSYADFIDIRCLNFLFYGIYTLGFYKLFFQLLRNLDLPLVDFFMGFISPDPNLSWPKAYLQFVSDFKAAIIEELFDSQPEAVKFAETLYRQNDNNVGRPSRINVFFGARLIYLEQSWVNQVLLQHLKAYPSWQADETTTGLIQTILNICQSERIDLKNPEVRPEPIAIDYDILTWRKDKYKGNLLDQKIPPKTIVFRVTPNVKQQIQSFNESFKTANDWEYYYNAMEFINRSDLIYQMAYEELIL